MVLCFHLYSVLVIIVTFPLVSLHLKLKVSKAFSPLFACVKLVDYAV